MRVVPFIKKNSSISCSCPISFSLLILSLAFFIPTAGARPFHAGNLQDTSAYIVISSIRIEGIKLTRPGIVLRELPFREKDTVARKSFPDLIRAGKENVFNTALFTIVSIDTLFRGGSPVQSDVTLRVIERWYIWPMPYFEVSDRNFNSWLQTMDFSRLTYGIDLTVLNARGRNETLKVPIHFGFNQKIGFSYKIPYLNRKKTLGMAFGTDYQRNHEVIAETRYNKTVYYKDPVLFPRQNLHAFVEMTLRQTLYCRHTFRAGFNSWIFSDSLLKYPGYAVGNDNDISYFSLYYQYKNDHRDVQFYPLHGFYFDAELDQNGLWNSPVNEFYIKTNFRKYMQIHNRWYFATGLTLKVTLTPQPPYFMQRGLGYGRDFVRGYEYYVVDGKNYLLWKNNLKFAILPQRVFTLGFLKSPKFNTIPCALYLDLFGDTGYVYNTGADDEGNTNDLQNSMLFGYGAGLDFATYYDIVIRLEFSVNRKGEPGLYLHFMAPI
jgi:outer membrane protein assembly factor BamA